MGPCCLLSREASCWTNQAIDFKSGLPSTHCLCILRFLPTLFAPLAPVCSCFRSVLSPLLGARLGLLRRQLLVQHCESNTDWMLGSHHSLSVTRASGGEPVLLLFLPSEHIHSADWKALAFRVGLHQQTFQEPSLGSSQHMDDVRGRL